MYQAFGGADGVRTLTDRFYDLMELEPQYRALRNMHGEDMTLIREKLYEFSAAGSAGRSFLSKNTGIPSFAHATCLLPSICRYATNGLPVSPKP
jgi:cysteine desulfurase